MGGNFITPFMTGDREQSAREISAILEPLR
jgi:hypothetical protein